MGLGWSKTSGGGQPQPGGGAEPVAQLDGGERVEAQLLEGPGRGRPPSGRRGRARRRPGRGPGPASSAFLFGGRPVGPAARRAVAPASATGAAAWRARTRPRSSGGDAAARLRSAARSSRVRARSGAGPGAAPRRTARCPPPRLSGGSPSRARRLHVGVATGAPAHAAGVGPQAPGEGGGGQAVGAAVVGEGVEEGVGGGVVGLAGAAEDAGDGGEQDEGGEVEVAGQLVQVPGGVDLGPQDARRAAPG